LQNVAIVASAVAFPDVANAAAQALALLSASSQLTVLELVQDEDELCCSQLLDLAQK